MIFKRQAFLFAAVMLLLTTSLAFAETRIAFIVKTDPSGFVDGEQKVLADVATELAKDFTKHAKDDHVLVVATDAAVTITVLERNNRMGGLVGFYARGLAGQPTEIELRVGNYATTIKGLNTKAVAKEIRQWLKDNQHALQEVSERVLTTSARTDESLK